MTVNPEQNIEKIQTWLGGLDKFSIRPGLERMEYMMERLNHPHRRLKFIHIAGTNGKGSTSAYLAAILREAGHDVGLFTSPYIESFHSRIQNNGEPISDENLFLLQEKIRPIVEEMADMEIGEPTEFEVVTALAILYFATIVYPDIVVWETGLGGRLDSTNIVHPIATVITNIGLDHMNILGHDIPSIAREKAGIIKSGVPLITGERKEEALHVILEVARQKNATVYRPDVEYEVNRREKRPGMHGEMFDFKSIFGALEACETPMAGKHQVENAGIALMTLQVLGKYFALYTEEKHIRAGLLATVWPGRFEKISEAPIVVLDGAHNADGIKALRQTVEEFYPGKRISLVFAVLADKPYQEMIEIIAPVCKQVRVTKVDNPRSQSPDKLVSVFGAVIGENRVHSYMDWREALHDTIHTAESDDIIVVAGSLYFISDVRKEWKEKYRKAGD